MLIPLVSLTLLLALLISAEARFHVHPTASSGASIITTPRINKRAIDNHASTFTSPHKSSCGSNAHSSSTSASTNSYLASSIATTTYTARAAQLPSVTPNPAITASSYISLTNEIPAVLNNAIEISSHSWEVGALTETLLEVYNPCLTPFEWNDTCFGGDVPWAMFSVLLDAISGYNWTGAPSSDPNNLADYLDPSTAPTPLIIQPLANGSSSLGDPNSLGPAVWVLARFAQRDDVRGELGLKCAGAYAWAVGNQLGYLKAASTSANGEEPRHLYFGASVTKNFLLGTISDRDGYFEVWSDMGGVIPPFPACKLKHVTLTDRDWAHCYGAQTLDLLLMTLRFSISPFPNGCSRLQLSWTTRSSFTGISMTLSRNSGLLVMGG